MNLSSSFVLLMASVLAVVAPVDSCGGYGWPDPGCTNPPCTNGRMLAAPGKRHLVHELDVIALENHEWQDYQEKCGSFEFDFSLFVDSHVYLFASPSGDAIAAGCHPLLFHANAYVGEKEVAKIENQDELVSIQKETIGLRTFQFSEIAAVFEKLDKVVTESDDIVLKNCGDFAIDYMSILGLHLVPAHSKHIAERLVNATNGYIVTKIYESENHYSLLVNGDATTDEELVYELVETRTRALYV